MLDFLHHTVSCLAVAAKVLSNDYTGIATMRVCHSQRFAYTLHVWSERAMPTTCPGTSIKTSRTHIQIKVVQRGTSICKRISGRSCGCQRTYNLEATCQFEEDSLRGRASMLQVNQSYSGRRQIFRGEHGSPVVDQELWLVYFAKCEPFVSTYLPFG